MIPVYIHNRDLIASPMAMVEYLRQIPEADPIIVDEASTYPPLLRWYAEEPCRVIRNRENFGPMGWIRHIDKSAEFYVGTDSDLDLSGVPLDVLDVCRDALLKYKRITKAGLSLEIRDVKNQDLIEYEKKYWKTKVCDGWWDADIGCTFAMHQKGKHGGPYGPALRADRPYTAIHTPWHWTRESIGEEERYYLEHATARGPYYTPRLLKMLLGKEEPEKEIKTQPKATRKAAKPRTKKVGRGHCS